MKKTAVLRVMAFLLTAALLGSCAVYAEGTVEGKYIFSQHLSAEAAKGLAFHSDDPPDMEYFYTSEFEFTPIDSESVQFYGFVFHDISYHTGEVEGVAKKIGENTYKYTYENEYLLFKFDGDKLSIEESDNFSFHGARVTFAHEYDKEIEIKVTLNGNPVKFDQPPIMENDRTLVPMRAIFEAMGATVEWDEDTQTVKATKGDTVILMTIGNNVMTKNGQPTVLDVSPEIVGERTLVPTRAVAEGLGAKVEWDEASQTVIIKS